MCPMTQRIAAHLVIVVFALAAMLTSAGIAPAQTSSQGVGKKAGETAEAIKDYAVEKKREAVDYAKKVARKMDTEIKELETKASKATGEAKVKSQQQIAELKKKRAAASKKLSELGKATASSWDAAKQGFIDAYKDLRDSLDKAAAELKKA